MIVLDLLYLPILQMFVKTIYPAERKTPGEFVSVAPSTDKWYDIFLHHNYTIYPCSDSNDTSNWSEGCDTMCSGDIYWRLAEDNSLRYYDDVILPCIGLMLFRSSMRYYRDSFSLVLDGL